jgi:two-component system, NtrC family, sensor histidine kinase KinB
MDTNPDHSLFASLPYAACLVDDQGKIFDINPALERLLGWQLSELRDQALSRCLEQQMVDSAQALCWNMALSQAIAQGQTTHFDIPTEFRTEFAHERQTSITGVVAPYQGNSAGQPKALIIFHDVKSQKDAAGVRTRFLAVLAHELSGPVTTLIAAADQLTGHLSGEDSHSRRLARLIQAEVKHLRQLLAQSFTPLPPGAEIPQARKRLVTLRPCLHHVAQAFQLRDLDSQIAVQVPPDLPFAWSDADRIKEILNKLVDNATRYAPPGSQILLTAEERRGEIVISVRDQGPGVADEDRESIFEPWRRGSHEPADAGHQGLGLSMARTMVQALDGKLWYEENPEGGACFCFSLPRAEGLPSEEGEGEGAHGSHPLDC